LIGGHFVFIFGPTFTPFLVYPVFSGCCGNLAFPALPVHRVTWDRPAVPAYPDFPPIPKSKRLKLFAEAVQKNKPHEAANMARLARTRSGWRDRPPYSPRPSACGGSGPYSGNGQFSTG
jgi:hypothetical protein